MRLRRLPWKGRGTAVKRGYNSQGVVARLSGCPPEIVRFADVYIEFGRLYVRPAGRNCYRVKVPNTP